MLPIEKFCAELEPKFKGVYLHLKAKNEEQYRSKCGKFNGSSPGHHYKTFCSWVNDIGNKFVYDRHHGAEWAVLNEPKKYFELWSQEGLEYFCEFYFGDSKMFKSWDLLAANFS